MYAPDSPLELFLEAVHPPMEFEASGIKRCKILENLHLGPWCSEFHRKHGQNVQQLASGNERNGRF